ncbi:E3 ubiquitin-protein ligase TRIM39-like [Tachysurus ichikawai]
MNEQGYTRTWQQCQRKIKSLKLIYRKAKDNNNNRSGRARVTCPFFEELDRVLGDKPSFVPGDGEVLDTASLVDEDQCWAVTRYCNTVTFDNSSVAYRLTCLQQRRIVGLVDANHCKHEEDALWACFRLFKYVRQ